MAISDPEYLREFLKLYKIDSLEENPKLTSKAKENEFKNPNQRALEDTFEQKRKQRNVLFWFCLFWTSALLILLIFSILLQIYVKLKINQDIVLIDKVSFNILAVSIFSQFVGIILIIAKSLWDDDIYKQIILTDRQKNM